MPGPEGESLAAGYTGEAAALAVTACWATGSLLFAWAAERIGAFSLNVARLTLAAVVFAAVLWIRTGRPFPARASAEQASLLALSGLIGLAAGDYFFFRSLALVGPRLATLLAASAPLFTAVIGRAFLAERLGLQAIAGMTLTLAGTFWVILERTPNWPGSTRARLGAAHGLAAALAQAIGLSLSKGAMRGLDSLSAASIRMGAALLFSWLVAAGIGRAGPILQALARPRVLAVLAAGALVGPVAGMWLSLYAVQRTETAVAATLMALTPITILPLVAVVYRERPTPRAVLGATVAVAGVALLVLR